MPIVAYGYGLDSTLGGTGTRITLAELSLVLGAPLDLELVTMALEMELRERMELDLGFPRMELVLS